MTPNREKIENAVATVLKNAGVSNVRIDVNTEEIKYPVVVVNMSGESKQDPRLASEITVDVMCQSIIGREESIDKTHYNFVDNVRIILYSRGKNGMYNRLWGAGLPVGHVLETIDAGTDINEEEGGSMAITTIQTRFRLAR